MAVSTNPDDPNFGLEGDVSSPNFGLAVAEPPQTGGVGGFAKGVGQALVGAVKGLIPTSFEQAAEMATPAAGAIRELTETVPRLSRIAFGESPISKEFPQEKTYPEFTATDWGKFLGEIGVNVGLAALLKRGLAKPTLSETAGIVEPKVEAPIETPAETPITDTVAPVPVPESVVTEPAPISTQIQPEEVIPSAIQEPSAGEVLQRQPEEAGAAGGERVGVEPSVQGEEAAQTQPETVGAEIGGQGAQVAPKEPIVYVSKADVSKQRGFGAPDYLQHDKELSVLRGESTTREELPQTVYHVTTAADAVDQAGMLVGDPKLRAGLGKGSSAAHQGVSVTTSLEDAKLIEQELLRASSLARGDVPDFAEWLTQTARTDEKAAGLKEGTLQGAVNDAVGNFEVNANQPWSHPESSMVDGYNYYLHMRESRGGAQNPILMGGVDAYKSIDPSQIKILEIPSKNIPESALIRKDPISKDFMHEVMVHSDIPLKEPAPPAAAEPAATPAQAPAGAGKEIWYHSGHPEAGKRMPLYLSRSREWAEGYNPKGVTQAFKVKGKIRELQPGEPDELVWNSPYGESFRQRLIKEGYVGVSDPLAAPNAQLAIIDPRAVEKVPVTPAGAGEAPTPEVGAPVAPKEAAPAPLGEQAAPVSDQPHVSTIANRFTQERTKTGELGEIAPGQGYSTRELAVQGLKMPPEEINQHVSDLMQGTGDPVQQGMAVRAEEARLSQQSADLSRAASANPSVEAKLAADNAFKDVTDFHNGPVARLKENWANQGRGMQGQIPLDLSTFNGLREAYLRDVGKPPPPELEPTLQKTADRVATSVTEENGARGKLGEEIAKATSKRTLPTAEDVRANILERMKTQPCRT